MDFNTQDFIRLSKNPPPCNCDYFNKEVKDQKYLLKLLNAVTDFGEHYSGGKEQFEEFVDTKYLKRNKKLEEENQILKDILCNIGQLINTKFEEKEINCKNFDKNDVVDWKINLISCIEDHYSQTKFSDLLGFTIGTRRLFERAHLHNQNIKNKNNNVFFFYSRKRKISQFPYTEKEILECFIENNLVKKLGDKFYRQTDTPLYCLTCTKTEACDEVADQLEIEFSTLFKDHFPPNIRKAVICSPKCVNCLQRSKLISYLNRCFGRKFSVETPIQNYLTDSQIKNITRVDPTTGVRRRLTSAEREQYFQKQEALKVLDSHFFDKDECAFFWRNILVNDNIREDTVIVITDGMCTLHVGSGENIRGISDTTPRAYIVPIGFIFLYSCPITGETKRLSRVCIPNSTIHNAHQYVECLKGLFKKNDHELHELFRTRNKIIFSHDCANNLESKEWTRFVLFESNQFIPQGLVIRVVDWIPRIQLHGTNSADKFFGTLKILFFSELKSRDNWFESKEELIHWFRNKFRSLNNNNPKNNYRIWAIHISRPQRKVKLLDLPGLQTTKWLRVKFRNDESVISLTNFIDPWSENIQRKIYSGKSLKKLLVSEERTESQRKVKRISSGKKLKTIQKKQDLGKRNHQFIKKRKWKETYQHVSKRPKLTK